MRRTLCRLAFSTEPVFSLADRDALSFKPIVGQLGDYLKTRRRVILRSEPQSGKTSLLHWLEKSCTVFSDKKFNSTGALPAVNAEKSKKAAERIGLGRYIVRYFPADQSQLWLPWAKEILHSPHCAETVILIDEAHQMYGDTDFGNFFKNRFPGKVLFVATSTGTTTITASTPFPVDASLYMEPAFANRKELVNWFKDNLKEAVQHRIADELVEHTAEAVVCLTGGRVGITNLRWNRDDRLFHFGSCATDDDAIA